MTLLRPVHRRLATPGCLVVLLALLLCAPAALAAQRKRSVPKAHRPPALSLYAHRAVLAYEAMQQNFYVPSAGLYKGEPEYSFLWPFSQALAASVSVAHIPGQQARLEGGLHALAAGLQVYSTSPAARGNDRDGCLHGHDGALLRRRHRAPRGARWGQFLRRQRVGRDRAGAHVRARPLRRCADAGGADHGVRDGGLADRRPRRPGAALRRGGPVLQRHHQHPAQHRHRRPRRGVGGAALPCHPRSPLPAVRRTGVRVGAPVSAGTEWSLRGPHRPRR